MKPLFVSLALLLPLLSLGPVAAQSTAPTAPTALEVLEACRLGQADRLPNPFTDISEADWAYRAVLTLYYCGAYRGAIPPEQFLRYQQSQASPS